MAVVGNEAALAGRSTMLTPPASGGRILACGWLLTHLLAACAVGQTPENGLPAEQSAGALEEEASGDALDPSAQDEDEGDDEQNADDAAGGDDIGDSAADEDGSESGNSGADGDEGDPSDSGDDADSQVDPSCDDDIQNQDESDVDCGGPWCPKCADGNSCNDNEDCRSKQCVDGECASVECQEDEDCRNLDDQCRVGECNTSLGICTQRDLADDQSCVPGNFCIVDGRCESGECIGERKDCSEADEACARGLCDPESGDCFAEPIGDGEPCNDRDPCTADDACRAGICRGTSGVPLFSEDFSNPKPGWQTRTVPAGADSSWSIGRAQSGIGCQIGQDPAQDASPDASEALAGVVIGGCAPASTGEHWDCLVSPKIPVSGVDEVQLEFARFLGTDLGNPSSQIGVFNRIEAEVDGQWQELFTGFANFIVDRAWHPMSLPISDLSQSDLRFRICYANRQAPGSAGFSGWSVDDVVVRNPNCTRD